MATSSKSSGLVSKKCKPCEGGTPALSGPRVRDLLKGLTGWQAHGGQIAKTYTFKNYYETMAFVNGTALISHREDHHPDLEVGYNKCTVRYSTHSVGGLSVNDFICAAKVDAMMEL